MTRRRWIYPKNGEPYEVGDDFVNTRGENTDASLWNDRGYDGLRATDGAPINSRKKHREYMRANDLTTMDDFKSTWKKEEVTRQDRMAGKDPTRRKDVEAALHKITQIRR